MEQQSTFDEIITAAIDVLGSRAHAERWLANPALGLEQRRPIDLISTPGGAQQVLDYLERLRHGVYT
jgi:putative toxin-antitoxin system antitoxin component (TIGR02293 family)